MVRRGLKPKWAAAVVRTKLFVLLPPRGILRGQEADPLAEDAKKKRGWRGH